MYLLPYYTRKIVCLHPGSRLIKPFSSSKGKYDIIWYAFTEQAEELLF